MEITRQDLYALSWSNKGDPSKFKPPTCIFKQNYLFDDAYYLKEPCSYYAAVLLFKIGCKAHYKDTRLIKLAILYNDITLFRNAMDRTKCRESTYEFNCGEEIIKMAVSRRNNEILGTILATEEELDLNKFKKTKDSVLFRAVETGNADVVKTLLKYGAEVNIYTNTNVNVFLQYCIHHHKDDNVECFRALYNHPRLYHWYDVNDLVSRAVRLCKWRILEVILTKPVDVDLSYKHGDEYGLLLDYCETMLKKSNSREKPQSANVKWISRETIKENIYGAIKIQKVIDLLKPIKERRRQYLCEETELYGPLIDIINNYT